MRVTAGTVWLSANGESVRCVVEAGTAFCAGAFFCGGLTLAMPQMLLRASLKTFAIRGEVSAGTSAQGRIASARLNWSAASLVLPVSEKIRPR